MAMTPRLPTRARACVRAPPCAGGGADLGGYHADTVSRVAKQMAATAASKLPQFIVNTGDNFYYCGINGTDDAQIGVDYLQPYGGYASLRVPWYSALGHHEYGYDVDAQIALSASGGW